MESTFSHDPTEYQFDPDCTLILYGLNGRNPNGIRRKFEPFGPISFWQPIPSYDTIIVAYPSKDMAEQAKASVTSEKLLFCTVVSISNQFAMQEDTQVRSNILLLPPQMRAFLTSPPPSPPEDWAPIHEDINRIAYKDLDARLKTDSTIQLLPPTPELPEIVICPPEVDE